MAENAYDFSFMDLTDLYKMLESCQRETEQQSTIQWRFVQDLKREIHLKEKYRAS